MNELTKLRFAMVASKQAMTVNIKPKQELLHFVQQDKTVGFSKKTKITYLWLRKSIRNTE
jgi:hypothetical protein